MPGALRRIMTEISFFDILVDVFIHRKMSKMVIAIFSPFLNSQSAEEVKARLKEEGKLPVSVYKGLFRKVSRLLDCRPDHNHLDGIREL